MGLFPSFPLMRRSSSSPSILDVTRSINSTSGRWEESSSAQSSLIPRTEALLASYDKMTEQERNDLLKMVLYRIEYHKEAGGEIVIDLYPKLPRF